MGITPGYGIGSLKPGVCTSSTRPASPFEGQMIYETDTDILAIYNGTAWKHLAAATKTGSVLQVVQGSTITATPVSTSTYIDTALSASITPMSASNKILVTVSQQVYLSAASQYINLRIVRNSTTILDHLQAVYAGASSETLGTWGPVYLDSPTTTSAITYKTTFNRTGAAGSVYCQANSNKSTITLTEISG